MNKERVLLVGSDPEVLSQLQKFFASHNFLVDRQSDFQEVKNHVLQDRYSFLFCHFEDASQLEFLKELWGQSQIPCQFFVAGPDEVSVAVQAMQYGARNYWVAPPRWENLEKYYQDGGFVTHRIRFGFHREETLLQMIKEIALTMELDRLSNVLIDSAMELVDADAGALLLMDEKVRQLVLKSARGLRNLENRTDFFGIPEKKYREILMNRSPVILQPMNPPVLTSDQEPVQGAVFVPIWWKNKALGELVLLRLGEKGGKFGPDDFQVLSLMGEEISGAVHNAIIHYKTKELTIKDDLTEAYNRRYFESYLEDELVRAERYGSSVSLIFLDLDNLKEVNVKYGHLVGSKTLQEVARRMILTVRGVDKVVRYGGDEFCVVLPETEVDGAVLVADRIRTTIAGKPFHVQEDHLLRLTGSLGIASYPVHAKNAEELIRQADRAMFSIKNRSKNAIGVAGEDSK